MRKIDGDQCFFAGKCNLLGCGLTMPAAEQLDLQSRDTIRRWIAQGAKEN
jgi:hypothetical protein